MIFKNLKKSKLYKLCYFQRPKYIFHVIYGVSSMSYLIFISITFLLISLLIKKLEVIYFRIK
jgi:hypothetical protein